MKITGAEALIKALEMEKVDVMFGYPGEIGRAHV